MKHSPLVQALAATVDEGVAQQVTDISRVMEALEVKALAQMNHLLDNGGSEKIRLEAAKDLLDRGSRTSKVQKIQSTNFNLTGDDARQLAAEVAAARRVREQFQEEVQGGWDRIPKEAPGADAA